MSLPSPDPQALAHSQDVRAFIREQIARHGPLSFADYMQHALYAPGLGYYTAGTQKFGEGGDFITAPEISSLFGKTLANAFAPILKQLNDAVILELGAGSGKCAADILLQLDEPPKHYYILEVSADLRARQQSYLSEHCAEHIDRIIWLDTLPSEPINGVIFANEVIDALPVHCFRLQDNTILEKRVTWQYDQFTWACTEADKTLQQAVSELDIPATTYDAEILLQLSPWLHSLRDCLQQGIMLFIDYGFPQHEYYHPDRNQGTLMCHYRHHTHSDPFFLPGLQDITAHVDFTHLACCADDCGLEVLGYCNQSNFLIEHDIETLAQPIDIKASQALRKLLFPHEMGELFKVMTLARNFTPHKPLIQCDLQDRL